MKIVRMIGTSVSIFLFFSVGVCFAERTGKQNWAKSVEPVVKCQFEKFSKKLHRISESEEFEKFVKELERLQEDLKRGGESAKEKIEKEIIPRLKEEIEKLKEKFLKPRGKEVEEPIQV